jgi:NAD(P)-dependent dehydrogenase (short-subunit alcohol dehydrogenase family)
VELGRYAHARKHFGRGVAVDTPMDFTGRVVIVTGAGRGLGRSHAKLLASRGASVVVNDLRGAAEVAAEIVALGGAAVPDEHDVSQEDQAAALVATAVDSFGGLDSIVNNAAISVDPPFAELSAEQFDRTIRVNVRGPFLVTKLAWPHLISSGSGRIVMTASRAPVTGSRKLHSYAASKGAMLGMTRQLASEAAEHGIGVNAISPSAFTELSRQGFAAAFKRSLFAKELGVDASDDELLMERSGGVVSAVVAWLCHPDCQANGEFFKAEAGDVGRLTFALAAGLKDPQLSIEAVRDNWEKILDMNGASYPPAYLESVPPTVS